MSRPRGFAAWAPQAATVELISDVRGVLETYRDHLPLTVRQVFYRLVATTGYDKTEQAYARLADHLVRARRAGMIPFGVLRDDGVNSTGGGGYDSVEDWVESIKIDAKYYRRDRQDGQDARVELWCEAEGMMPQLARVGQEYSVPVYSAGGFLSVTATYEIATRALNRDVRTILLHVGDYDPSGESIFTALVDDVTAFVDDRGGLRPEAIRVALTPQQVAAYELPTAPAKKSDSRSANWRGGDETCQAESLPPNILAMLVDQAITAEFDLDVFEDLKVTESEERARVVAKVSELE